MFTVYSFLGGGFKDVVLILTLDFVEDFQFDE